MTPPSTSFLPQMTSSSSSIFRHHYTPFLTATVRRRFAATFPHRLSTNFQPLEITSSSSRNQNLNRKSQPPNKHMLKARDTVKQMTSLSPSLSADNLHLSPGQAVGKVASAQANFMRVVIESPLPSTSPLKLREDVDSPLPSTEGRDEGVEIPSASPLRLAEGVGEGMELPSNSPLKLTEGVESPLKSTEGVGEGVELPLPEGRSEGVELGSNSRLPLSPALAEGEGVELASKSWLTEGGGGGESVELLCVVRNLLKKIKRRVLVGDKVLVGAIDWTDRRGMIENVFERKSEVLDPPVANVDHLLVLFSLDQPKPEEFSLTRFLVEAESTRIPVTLAFNKTELVDQETVASWKSKLRSWGYEPIFCSVETKSGLDSLQFNLRDQTSVIVGPSGVGKSSLINALRSNHFGLLPADLDDCSNSVSGSKWLEDQRVGEVSARSGRGKHTTRHVSLLPLSGGGYIADTPGFNQPSLLKVTKQSLALCFPEVRKVLSDSGPLKCAFSNCLHLGEPGCLVKTDWERYPYYVQLLDEIKIREELQLRTLGTKREGPVRYKAGDMGVMQAEPRLEPKKHRRQSRKKTNQSLLHGLDEELEDADDESYLDDDPIIRAMEKEKQ